MTTIRALIAVLLFLYALFEMLALFIVGFSFSGAIIASVLCLVAYWLWPSKRNDPRHPYQHSRWYDWLEFLVELPVEIFLSGLRFIFSLLRRSVDDIDIID